MVRLLVTGAIRSEYSQTSPCLEQPCRKQTRCLQNRNTHFAIPCSRPYGMRYEFWCHFFPSHHPLASFRVVFGLQTTTSCSFVSVPAGLHRVHDSLCTASAELAAASLVCGDACTLLRPSSFSLKTEADPDRSTPHAMLGSARSQAALLGSVCCLPLAVRCCTP